MKKIILHIFLLLNGLMVAQTTNPDLLVTIQKASQSEIDAYNTANLELGMLVYNTDENRIYEYTNQGWLKLRTELDNTPFIYADIFNNQNSNLTINQNSNGVIIPLNTIRLQNSLPSLSNNQIAITETGVYEISYSISLQKISNSPKNNLEIIICENNTPLPNTGIGIVFQQIDNNNGNGNNGNGNGNNGNGNNGNGNNGNTENITSASRTVLLNLNSGNNYGIKLRGLNFNTNDTIDVTMLGSLSGLTIRKIN